jgi:hypothetical protein
MERTERGPGPRGITRRVLIALLLAMLSVGGFLGATSPAPRSGDGIQVKFKQLNWRGAGKTIRFPNSRVATAVFSFDRTAADQLIGKGSFVNLVVQVPGRSRQEWVVRNLRLRYKDERFLLGSHPSVQFPLPTPNGFRVEQLSYVLTVTPKPLAAPPAGRLASARVEAKLYRVGGLHNGGSDRTNLVSKVRPFVGHRAVKLDAKGDEEDEPVLDVGASTLVPASELPAINEGTNGCAPAGVARSIEYMMENQGAFIDSSAQDIYDSLHDNMGTTEQNGTATDQDIADGKGQFASDNDLDIDTSLEENGVGSAGDAMDTLNNGGDVEILISWPEEDGGGGHVAMISSIVDNGDGTYQITYVDDPDQGDGVAENEEVVITVDGNGDIIEGGAGHIDGLLIETLHTDPPPPPPPPPPGGPVVGGGHTTVPGGH